MKILLVCYYFPPTGMGGVQRPAKFAKYLARFGHEVTVIAAEPQPGEITDDTLLNDIPDDVRVIRLKVPHPRNLIRRMRGSKSNTAGSRTERSRFERRLAAWSRVPDDKIGFIPGALAAAKKAFPDNPPDVVMTTSPPPSIHIIGRRLQRLWTTTWVADFRDPWFLATDVQLPTPVHRAIRSRLLGNALKHADKVVAVSPGIVDDFREWGFKRDDIEIITNGYDEDDFAQAGQTYDTLPPERFRFHLYGTISPHAPPDPFFRALSAWLKEHPDMADKIEVSHRGAVSGVDLDELIKKYDLRTRVASLGYAPHWFAVQELKSADALVISVADRPGLKSNIPGRVYECLRSGRPIIAFVPPDGAAAGILKEFKGVWVVGEDILAKGTSIIEKLCEDWELSAKQTTHPRMSMRNYSREHLTARLLKQFGNNPEK